MGGSLLALVKVALGGDALRENEDRGVVAGGFGGRPELRNELANRKRPLLRDEREDPPLRRREVRKLKRPNRARGGVAHSWNYTPISSFLGTTSVVLAQVRGKVRMFLGYSSSLVTWAPRIAGGGRWKANAGRSKSSCLIK